MVLEIQRVIPVGIQCHHLGVCVIQPGSGDGFFGHLINAGQKILQLCSAVGVRPDLIHTVAVCRLDQKHGIGNGFAGIGVVLVNNEIGPLLILNGDLGSLAGEQLHMVLPEVDDMIGGGSGFLHRIHTRLQIGNQNLALGVGDAVEIASAILDLGNAEVNAAQRGTV